MPFKGPGVRHVRDVVQNCPADVVWYEDVERRSKRKSNGEVVLAVDLSRNGCKTLPDLMLLDDLRTSS